MKAREIMSKDHQPKIFLSMIIAIGHVPNIWESRFNVVPLFITSFKKNNDVSSYLLALIAH